MRGRIHALQSMGAVDGPGVRYVVFLQGCPLRCVYCHNPDTWPADGGTEMDSDALAEKILRCRPYLKNGGVTISGGEPLLQWKFCEALFQRLQAEGIHTALDTAGVGSSAGAARVLRYTDLVLCDIKFPTEAGYRAHCGGELAAVRVFLDQTAAMGVPLWVRHVVVPGLTDAPASVDAVIGMARSLPNLQRLEFLPFRKLCLSKYRALGLHFPLEETPDCPAETIRMCNDRLRWAMETPAETARP